MYNIQEDAEPVTLVVIISYIQSLLPFFRPPPAVVAAAVAAAVYTRTVYARVHVFGYIYMDKVSYTRTR
jgi:hypothetical protein